MVRRRRPEDDRELANQDRYYPGPIGLPRLPILRWTPDPEGICPPLPDPIPEPIPIPGPEPEPIPLPLPRPEPIPEPIPIPPFETYPWPPQPPHVIWPPRKAIPLRCLKGGCYLIRFTPKLSSNTIFVMPLVHYDGTLRVQKDGFNTIASGDLYLHQIFPYWLKKRGWWLPFILREPDPSRGIPIFSRTRYRYYYRVTQILSWCTISNSFTLGFERWSFDHNPPAWTNDGAFTARMKWTTAPSGYPSPSNYLEGEVKDSGGTVVGTLTMGWVSSYLRRCILEIDRGSQSETPLDNGSGIDWQDIYDLFGWDVDVRESDTNLTEPSGHSWSMAELHAKMLASRDSAYLDRQWRYHLLCVRNLDDTTRGIMYDAYAGDTNNIPREGAAISSHWVIPNTAQWGHVQGMRFGTATGPYFRTAVHEIGHAQGLYHNTADNGIMNTTGVIAGNAVPPEQFPDNVLWSFNAEDMKRLRHMPDPWVRPGGIPYGSSYNVAPILPGDMVDDVEGLRLDVAPLLDSVPIGAPVRVNISLANVSQDTMTVPESLSMRRGHVKGMVVDPSGAVRTFTSLLKCIEDQNLRDLGPGETVDHSITLLRGAQGALFPSPGVHRVIVEVRWDLEGFELRAVGEGVVMVTPPRDDDHAFAALKVLSTPDTLLTLALGGDHMKEGIEAIKTALDNKVLRPHYEWIEAKRVGRRFGKRKGDLGKASRLLDSNTVMSPAEKKRLDELITDSNRKKSDKAVQQMRRLVR